MPSIINTALSGRELGHSVKLFTGYGRPMSSEHHQK